MMKEMKKTKRRGLTAALLFCSSLLSFGQQDNEQFSIATLNVDGLPQKVLVVKINTNGPGDTGSARIGKYLAKKDYDLVMMQEDFNYHGVHRYSCCAATNRHWPTGSSLPVTT